MLNACNALKNKLWMFRHLASAYVGKLPSMQRIPNHVEPILDSGSWGVLDMLINQQGISFDYVVPSLSDIAVHDDKLQQSLKCPDKASPFRERLCTQNKREPPKWEVRQVLTLRMPSTFCAAKPVSFERAADGFPRVQHEGCRGQSPKVPWHCDACGASGQAASKRNRDTSLLVVWCESFVVSNPTAQQPISPTAHQPNNSPSPQQKATTAQQPSSLATSVLSL